MSHNAYTRQPDQDPVEQRLMYNPGLNWLAKQRLIIKSRVRQSLAVIIPTSSNEVVNSPSNLVTQLAGQSVHMRWANMGLISSHITLKIIHQPNDSVT